jgi:hypothetical protein
MITAVARTHIAHSVRTQFSKQPYFTHVQKTVHFSKVTIELRVVREQK